MINRLIAWWKSRQQAKAQALLKAKLIGLAMARTREEGGAWVR